MIAETARAAFDSFSAYHSTFAVGFLFDGNFYPSIDGIGSADLVDAIIYSAGDGRDGSDGSVSVVDFTVNGRVAHAVVAFAIGQSTIHHTAVIHAE